MEERTYSRGLLFWIDDSLSGKEIPSDPWSELFGDYSDRIYRLMDLSLIVATNYEDAIAHIEKLDRNQSVGTFIYCIVDLSIPRQKTQNGSEIAKPKYGISIAKELKEKGYSFSFLSSSQGGTNKIDESGLGAIPYYVKEEGNIWKLPTPLMLKVLSEFHRHVKWISLDWIEDLVHPQTSVFTESNYSAMRYYPFFSYYRDYVERCEYRIFFDIDRPVVIRSDPKHCDEFVFQSVMVYYYNYYKKHPSTVKFLYGHAHSREFKKAILDGSYTDFDDTVLIVRINPDITDVDEVRDIFERNQNRRLAIILPDGESIDPYIEALRDYQICAVEELPKIREGDLLLQEELIKRSCILLFQEWYKQFDLGDSVLLHKGSFSYPQLIINPINWTVLLETKNVLIELSDPYEIILELILVLEGMGEEQAASIKELLNHGKPMEFRHLLRVGQGTISKAEHKEVYRQWSETSLDNWLKSSNQFPYGLFDYGSRSKFIPDEGKKAQIRSNMNLWQDSCYEILVELTSEYESHQNQDAPLSKKASQLLWVQQFINKIGGKNLLNGCMDDIDWEELEQVRWPHRQYPLPSAVFRRIREAGKYLWIQPEGLDLAQTFPSGRRKYRTLGAMADHYWDVLSWLKEISGELPLGWKENIQYLTNMLLDHKVLYVWENENDRLWQAFLSILSNGGPILFIANQLLSQRKISSGEKYLGDVKGYGSVLGYLRGFQQQRIGQWIKPSIYGLSLSIDLEKIKTAHTYFSNYLTQTELDSDKHLGELRHAIHIAVELISKLDIEDPYSLHENDFRSIETLMVEFLSSEQMEFYDSKDWFVDKMKAILPNHFDYGITNSLMGTKVDYLWMLLDTISALNNITRRFRYYDGYHFLAVLNDLRNKKAKNVFKPDIPLPMVEVILELFVESIEGIIAQMAWLLSISGKQDLADRIKPSSIEICPPDDFLPPEQEKLISLYNIQINRQDWELFTLGTPGEEFASNLIYHDGIGVHKLGV